jgi:serine/threonine protein kinase
VNAETKFALVKRLGEGQFGQVWLASDRALNVDRALKIIPLRSVQNRKNFFEEAQILQGIQHPNIVRVFEAGVWDESSIYIAMEYLPKGSVHIVSQGRPLLPSFAIRVACDALRGLHAAHEHRVIHRDVKPSNILLGNHGEGELSDFGLAAIIRPGRPRIVPWYTYHIAPEILNGKSVTKATDIYAMAVTVYRFLNGDEYLQSFEDDRDFFEAVKEGTFPRRDHYRMYIPRNLRTVVNRGMEVEPSARYESAEDFRHALEKAIPERDWEERTLPNGSEWVGETPSDLVQIQLLRVSWGNWSVSTRVGKTRKTLRSAKRYCFSGLTHVQAEIQARAVLRRYTR